MGFKSQAGGDYTIAINAVEGLFDAASLSIYLKDNLLNTLTDLKTTPYAFASEAGVFNGRFEIVYQNLLTVRNPEFNPNQVVIYPQNGNLIIDSGLTTMKDIKVFDVSGRLLLNKKNVNATQTSIQVPGNEMLLIQITAADGSMVTKKILN